MKTNIINMNRKFLSVIALSIMTLASCTSNNKPVATENPFLSDYGTPYEVPAFDKIQSEHYLPAFEEGMKQQKAEIDVIVKNRATPDFQNTILAYDKSGALLNKVGGVFFNLMECMSNDEMQNIAAEIMPKMSAHGDEIAMNPLLFEKVKYVYDNRHNMNLDDQQIRVVEKYYSDFIRSGAGLNETDKETLKGINERLSLLSLQFGNNLLAENANFKLVVDNAADLSGLPQSSIDAAAEQAAKEAAEEASEEHIPEDETLQEEIRRNSRTTSTSAKKTTTTTRKTTTKKEKSMLENVAEKAATSFGRSIANALARGILGSLLKK